MARNSGPAGRLEQYRDELTGYCDRILASAFEAQDAVQETMVRAWRNLDRFEGRSTLRSWLYSIATNVCFDMLKQRQRRAHPVELEASTSSHSSPGTPLAAGTRVEPVPGAQVVGADNDPAEQVASRETIRVAFVAALQRLPPRQRAVLILREVLSWRAYEVAELLDTTVAAVNSTLQRARATLAANDVAIAEANGPMDDEQAALLARYVDAFERYDIDSLVSLLHKDAYPTVPIGFPHSDLWTRDY